MILLDVNVLVRAHQVDVFGSAETLAWLHATISGDERVAVWDPILVSSYRVLTLPRLVKSARAPELAMEFLQQVRDVSIVIGAGERHWRLVRDLIEDSQAAGNLV